MGKGKKTILISGLILSFIAGIMVSGPHAIAANPVLEEIRTLLLDPVFGLEEIKDEVHNIETKVTHIEAILESEPTDPGCEDLGFTNCSGTCKDTSTDEANCGACGNACSAGEVCTNGVCQSQCAGSTTACLGQCVDTQSDVANCGGCGLACASGEFCVNGSCTPSCTTEVCDGFDNNCDGQVDEGNPGGGSLCSTGQLGVCGTGTIICSGGGLTCVQNNSPSSEVCDALDNDCDGQVDEGLSNPANTSCSSGTLVCNSGFADCNLDKTTDGCEASLLSVTNCGVCGNVCAAGETCSNGVCQAPP